MGGNDSRATEGTSFVWVVILYAALFILTQGVIQMDRRLSDVETRRICSCEVKISDREAKRRDKIARIENRP